ncbi:methyltransferase domain-containing protein [bacterium]|nr:methyltransferase domain-containing protein [bacterium]
MLSLRRLSLFLIAIVAVTTSVMAQEKSVKPGVNDSFRDPDVAAFVKRFEVESREVYTRRNEILAACQIQPGQTVADIGAGTGLFTRLFAEAVGPEGRVLAVDITPNFLKHIETSSRAAGLKNVETVLCTADSTELPPESVDVAFICDTYHHFEFPLKTMTSLQRALKPGGRVIVIDFRRVAGESSDWVLGHVRAGQEVFESEIIAAGYLKTREPADVLKENYFVEFTKSKAAGLREWQYPIIAGYGGVVAYDSVVEPPQPGMKLVFDVTADSSPNAVNKGLERAARVLNLYGLHGFSSGDVRIAIVFHGEATKSVLKDEFYALRYGVDHNPNLKLIEQLKSHGVELFVCGQALNAKGFAASTVDPQIPIAAAALTVILNKQTAGYTTLLIP